MIIGKTRDSFTCFRTDEDAVLGLPMRLTVSLIIGVVALAAILSFIINPCLFPSKMIISVTPMVNATALGVNWTVCNYTVSVQTVDGHPINDAIVIIKGLKGVATNKTNAVGTTIVSINATLGDGVSEGYLDVSVKAACRESFEQLEMLKIIRG